MRKQPRVVVSCLGILALIGAAPATRPVGSLADVESNYKNALAKAAEDRIDGLKTLRDLAMKDQDLNRANQLQKKIDEAHDPVQPAQDAPAVAQGGDRRKLEMRLAGSSWHAVGNKKSVWTLKRDGTFALSDGHVGQWAAIGPTTILLIDTEADVDQWTFDDKTATFVDTHGKIEGHWSGTRRE